MTSLVAASACGCLGLVDLGEERRYEPSTGGAGAASSGGGGTGGSDPGGSGAGGSGAQATGAGGSGGSGECSGDVTWTRRIGGPGDDYAPRIAPDGADGVFVCGTFTGQITLGDQTHTSQGAGDLFVARLDASGAYVWSRTFGDAAPQGGMEMAVLPDGRLVLAGTFQGTVDFGDGPNTADGYDLAVVALEPDGQHAWSHVHGGPGFQGARAVAVDASTGNVFVGGPFHQTVALGGSSEVSAGDADGLVLAYAPDGQLLWSRRFGGVAPDYVNAVAARGGLVAFGGTTEGDVDLGFGVTEAIAGGADDPWIALYDDGGSPVWAHRYADPGAGEGVRRAAFADTGDVIVSGLLQSSLDLDTFDLPAAAGVFVARLAAADGVVTDARSFSNVTDTVSLIAGPDDTVTWGGNFWSTLDLGVAVFASNGEHDGVAVELGADLQPIWAFRFGSADFDGIGGTTRRVGSTLHAVGTFRATTPVSGCPELEPAGGEDIAVLRLDLTP